MARLASAGHSFEDHTGEVRLALCASSLPELFVEAATALAELLLEPGHGPATGTPIRCEVRAKDREALLVAWLNELIFRSETEKRVFTEFSVELPSEGELQATIRGVPTLELRTAVKAATFHGLSIAETPDGFSAKVVLDV